MSSIGLFERTDQDSINLVFRVEEVRPLPDGGQLINVVAEHGGSEVGLGVELTGPWEDIEPDAHIPVWQSNVAMLSVGDASDQLVAAILESCGLHASSPKMIDRIPFIAVAPNDDPAKIADETVHMMFYFGFESGQNYSPFAVTADLPNKTLRIEEKGKGPNATLAQALPVS